MSRAEEIAASFINGNISWAVSEVGKARTKRKAAALALEVAEEIRAMGGIESSIMWRRAVNKSAVNAGGK